ncbi:hypothetical protein PFISCL1PPCAC_12896, partial [Pristionchus fissidentatus]
LLFYNHFYYLFHSGYYHSSALIGSLPSIAAKTKVKILSWSFSEAQAGKAASDRIASFVKRKMRSYKDAMHNVITPEEMFYAINATKQLRGVSVYVAKVVEEKKSTTKIPHISDLGHFDIHGNSAKGWRFYLIGPGIDIHGLNPSIGKFTIVETKDKVKLMGDSLTKPPGAWEEPWFWLLRPERSPMFNQEPHDFDDEIVTSLITVLTSKKPKTRFTRALFDGYDENDIMEEVEPSEEDIVMSDEQMHEFLLPNLSHFFSDVNNPI